MSVGFIFCLRANIFLRWLWFSNQSCQDFVALWGSAWCSSGQGAAGLLEDRDPSPRCQASVPARGHGHWDHFFFLKGQQEHVWVRNSICKKNRLYPRSSPTQRGTDLEAGLRPHLAPGGPGGKPQTPRLRASASGNARAQCTETQGHRLGM